MNSSIKNRRAIHVVPQPLAFPIARQHDYYEEAPQILGKTAKVPQLLKELPDGVIYDFQRILENILSLRQTKKSQIIGITSANSHEGTSTVAAILSLLAAARQHSYFRVMKNRDENRAFSKLKVKIHIQNILLIDAQLKNPTLHKLLGVDLHPGLNDVLESKVILKDSVRSIANSQLKFIPTGNPTDAPLFHLYFDDLERLLKRMRPYLHFIFVDIPPLLEYAEGITLSKLCDGIILIIKSTHTRWEAVREAKNLLEKAHINILGTVLNAKKSYVPNWLVHRL
ncbi:hypothetical protein EH223_16260 [candidate division KSB1 bacterium]|nr:CpsD/CapB family tyrosine-protein kinase [candidate division KSB1 bacterium]RQW01079.1 MAG: hypothetical protein EH223_16260 [candidate division KSB1 bacterium]